MSSPSELLRMLHLKSTPEVCQQNPGPTTSLSSFHPFQINWVCYFSHLSLELKGPGVVDCSPAKGNPKIHFWFQPLSSWWLNQPLLKNISQNGNLPQRGVKLKNIWNHHLVMVLPHVLRSEGVTSHARKSPKFKETQIGGCRRSMFDLFFVDQWVDGKTLMDIG